MKVSLTLRSKNEKTGPIPVSTSCASSCPATCPFKEGGCYAKGGPLAIHWRRVTQGEAGDTWEEFCRKVETLPEGQLWRHNQAGDLPGEGNAIDESMMLRLVEANEGKRGFTYTHKPVGRGHPVNTMLVFHANEEGFTVNLSANSPAHADELLALAIGPVVTVLPEHQTMNTTTPKGHKIVVCPAVTKEGVSCASCGLCARGDRKVVIGFPAHGSSKRKANAIAAS